ncbi:UNVERIFIED_CONTAM: hypothetical protein Slati_2977400 [Sesamum latifolium]|uniref:Uncharacterized protein n=1 Tax=Sesamum latifolium TaxID=2727402 RepID=A0AAW2VI48_9LAMI
MTVLGHYGDLAKAVVDLQKLLDKSRKKSENWRDDVMRLDLHCRDQARRISELEGRLEQETQTSKAQIEQLQVEIRNLRHNEQYFYHEILNLRDVIDNLVAAQAEEVLKEDPEEDPEENENEMMRILGMETLWIRSIF